MKPDQQPARGLRQQEHILILALLSSDQLAAATATVLDDALVIDMQDGGMGSIKFVRDGKHFRSQKIAEAQYLDEDGVLVSIEVSVDEEDELCEVDFWKVDFSLLKRYPQPLDLKPAST